MVRSPAITIVRGYPCYGNCGCFNTCAEMVSSLFTEAEHRGQKITVGNIFLQPATLQGTSEGKDWKDYVVESRRFDMIYCSEMSFFGIRQHAAFQGSLAVHGRAGQSDFHPWPTATTVMEVQQYIRHCRCIYIFVFTFFFFLSVYSYKKDNSSKGQLLVSELRTFTKTGRRNRECSPVHWLFCPSQVSLRCKPDVPCEEPTTRAGKVLPFAENTRIPGFLDFTVTYRGFEEEVAGNVHGYLFLFYSFRPTYICYLVNGKTSLLSDLPWTLKPFYLLPHPVIENTIENLGRLLVIYTNNLTVAFRCTYICYDHSTCESQYLTSHTP